MTRINRRTLISGAAATALTGLAGCTQDGQSDQSNNQPSDADLSDVSIEAWNEGNHFGHMETVADAFNEEHESTVDPVEKSQVDNLSQEVLLTLSSGDPDQMPGATIIRSRFLRQAARKGGIEEINDLMEDHVDDLFPAAKGMHRVDGDWYSTPQDLGPTLWFYNQDIFDEAGLPTNPDDVANEIETWSDFADAAQQVDDETGAKMFATSVSDSVVPVELLSMMGGIGAFYNADGEFQFDKQGNIRAMNVLKDLLPYTEETFMFQGDGSYWGGFENGEIASMPYPAWAKGFITENLPDQSGQWRVTRMPYHEDDPQQRRSGNLGGEPIMIPRGLTDEQKMVAKQFSEAWNLSEEGVNAKLEIGVFPAVDVDSADAWEAEDEYFGGQKVNEAMAASARAAGPSRYAPNPRTEELMMEAIGDIIGDDAGVEETLSSYHDQMVDATDDADLQISVNN